MKYINIFLIITIALSTACEKTIHVKIEDKGRKVVVNSIFAADSTLNISLFESKHIQNGTYDFLPVSDASISLFENDVEVGLANSENNGIYYFDHIPQENASYGIVVNSPKHGIARSNSIIPKKAIIDNIEYDLNETNDQFSNYLDKIDFKIRFKDIGNEANYYLVQVEVKEIGTYYNPDLDEEITYTNYLFGELDSYDPSLVVASYEINGLLFNDELFDGKEHTINFSANYYYYWDPQYSDIKFYFTLFSLSKGLYNYYLSYTRYLDAKDDPFSEPVKVYNNIENGFGIFGGYSSVIDSVEIEIPVLVY